MELAPIGVQLYSSSLSQEIEIIPPITIHDKISKTSTTWTPKPDSITKEWTLLIDPRSKLEGSPWLVAIPTQNSSSEKRELTVVNLTNHTFEGTINSQEFELTPKAFSTQEIPDSKLSIKLNSIDSLHYSQTTLSEINSIGHHLLIVSEPYLENSAMLLHRMVQLEQTAISENNTSDI